MDINQLTPYEKVLFSEICLECRYAENEWVFEIVTKKPDNKDLCMVCHAVPNCPYCFTERRLMKRR